MPHECARSARADVLKVFAKAFPSIELSGDALTWYVRSVLPELRRTAADMISFFTLSLLPDDPEAFPSTWFTGLGSRFKDLYQTEREGWAEEALASATNAGKAVALAKGLPGQVILE